MNDDNYEPNRVFGLPGTTSRYARQGEEPQRAMGLPADWFGPVDPRLAKAVTHPVRAYRQWRRRRRLGIYAPDDDQAAE
ncbi:MAG: hypothetical protein ACRDPO_02970 [Streptosporangiaceae bacterium]